MHQRPTGSLLESSRLQCIAHDQYCYHKFIWDFWNKIDIFSIAVYIIVIVCRFLPAQSPDSFLSTLASYFYGTNTIVLSLRVFGHTMEVTRSTGTKQIALMKIVKAVGVIFIQMLSAILGFSFALTKVYMAEVSKTNDAKNSTAHGVCGHSVGVKCWWHFIEFLAWSSVGDAQPDSLNLKGLVSHYISKALYLLFLIVVAVIIMNMFIALLSNKYQQVENNAFFEWAFKKACLIKTYGNHHPIPIPFCIISLPIQACTEFLSLRKHKKHDKSGQMNTIDKEIKTLCDNMATAYFAEHGKSFATDKLAKIDHTLIENRFFMGHIAEEIFKENDTVADSLQSDWEYSEGIRAVGRRLFHVQCTYCRNKLKYPHCVHGARFTKPISRDYPGFEVLIQQSGKKRFFGIGVANKDYNLFDFPGKKKNSVGYHIDSGKIFEGEHAIDEECDAVMSFSGDVVGCTVLFDSEKDQYIPVQFTRNSCVIGEAKMKADLIKEGVYPLISMAFPRFHVLFRRIARAKETRRSSDDRSIAELEQMIKQMAETTRKCEEILKSLKRSTEEQLSPRTESSM